MECLKTNPSLSTFSHLLNIRCCNLLLGLKPMEQRLMHRCLAEYSDELAIKIEELSKAAFKMAGEEFNMDSPKQLVEILYNKLDLPVLKKPPRVNLQPMRILFRDWLKNMIFQKLLLNTEVWQN